MSHTIRERGQKVFQAVNEKSTQGITTIASAIGISKSSVHRHEQAIQRRNQYPESEFWESEAGSAWLRLLVFGSIFFFGIKHGIGVGELSQFLKALRLGLHVGCSPSALTRLKAQMKEAIVAYEASQADHCRPAEGQGIGVGSDEVFFGLPVLVLMELGSGYIFTEVQSEDRTYATWRDQIQGWWSQSGSHTDIVRGIHAWWLWATHALETQTSSVELQNWVITALLPWVYWLEQTDKTQQHELKARYQQASDNAAQQLLDHPITQTMVPTERQIWIDWAKWMVTQYQSTSSAVEGRNGYLTRLHHSGRGFSEQTLKVLTIIHNFHLKRPDGSTAAQRLFNYEFPDLFDWVVDHMGALPLARQSKKAYRPNPFHLEGFPA